MSIIVQTYLTANIEVEPNQSTTQTNKKNKLIALIAPDSVPREDNTVHSITTDNLDKGGRTPGEPYHVNLPLTKVD